jgi:hypothetical protein
MPDKYSYKANKKKKTGRRPVIANPVQPSAISQVAPVIEMDKPAAATRPTLSGTAAPPDNRGIARVSNLGAELRRLVLITGAIIIILVAASIILK